MSAQYYEGIGRRKAASARVRIFPGGTGRIVINDRDGNEYISRAGDMEIIMEPLRAIGQERGYDISVHVNGGGVTGQRDAIQLGLARALLKLDPDLRAALREHDLLSRDPRVKERKKPGLKRARKAPTYTKR
ncbi:MAG: 30S ribosomal protein S9 [Chloroflexi bacterium]|nr:30S ribosomal protein S9 [Chloroflexota bacterium]